MRVATRSRNARSCVTTMQRRAIEQQLFEPLDAVDVEVVGRLVEQQQVGLERQRARPAPRACVRRPRAPDGAAVAVEAEAVQVLDQARFGAPALALVLDRIETDRARRRLRATVARGGQLGLLLDMRDAQARAAAASRHRRAAMRPAMTSSNDDLPVPLRPIRPMRSPGIETEVGTVEQRLRAEGEFGARAM